jgi:hypothetical protein
MAATPGTRQDRCGLSSVIDDKHLSPVERPMREPDRGLSLIQGGCLWGSRRMERPLLKP